MALTNAFREAVKTGNVRRIRIMMKDSLLTDPTFQHLKEMEQAASSIQGLYDPHDGKEFEQNVQKWNDDYMNRQMVRVVSNFSHERIAHLKEVVRYLRPVSETAKKSSQTRNGNHETVAASGTKVAAGAFVGAAIGATAVVAASGVGGTVVAGTLAGAVIGGGAAVVYQSLNGRK
jgi:hypothetical protein